ncbi:EAL domain-containing protein [Bacillus sp. FJAT-29814]|uniref:EAL domain-containing protein n=1 Tax=Bacillus sp. FJAT-29814 TaxID=1729688 RepID=UPI0020A39B99|nr:EAL domain-containing protein [Bacillus sp. FJAT-29814]
MQKIIKHHTLDTFFQPILNLKSGETVGYEILNRPGKTTLFSNTETFYDFVGQTNQVFLFECFCRNLALKRFIDRNKENVLERSPLIFINIHPHVLLDSNYHSGETRRLLSELGIDPKQVVFELTEKSAVTDFELFEKVLSNYRSQGFRIAVDDVGSGYNSLKTLIYLKPEFIKLDRSLIQNIDKNREQQQLVKLIIEYAKQSSSQIIAEGIERIEELAFISEQGVDFGQGYALGKPKEEVKPGRIPEYSRSRSLSVS